MFFRSIISVIIFFISTLGWASGKTLYVAVPNPITSTDPLLVKTAQDNFIIPLIYGSLFRRNLDGDLEPHIAKSFKEVGGRLKKLQVVLNSNIYFSNGSQVEVSDVINSLKVYCKDEKSYVRLSVLKGCHPEKNLKIVKSGPNVLEIEVTTNYLYAVEQLSYGGIGIFKKVNGKRIGSGVFETKRINQNSTELVFNSFNSFWKQNETNFSKIVFKFIPEKEMPSLVESEKVHMASMYFRETISNIKNSKYSKIIHAENVVNGIVLNQNSLPLKDNNLRKMIQKDVYNSDFSSCRADNSKLLGMIPEGIGGYVSEDELLKKEFPLSHKDYVKSNLIFYRHSERKNVCEELQIIKIFRKYNISLEIIHIDSYNELFPKYLDQKTDGYIELFVYNSLDASSLLKRFLAKKDANVFFYSSKSITENLRLASNQKVLTNRFKYYREINKEIYDKGTFLAMNSISHTSIIHKCLVKKQHNSQRFNPNSFLYLLKLDFSNECILKGHK